MEVVDDSAGVERDSHGTRRRLRGSRARLRGSRARHPWKSTTTPRESSATPMGLDDDSAGVDRDSHETRRRLRGSRSRLPWTRRRLRESRARHPWKSTTTPRESSATPMDSTTTPRESIATPMGLDDDSAGVERGIDGPRPRFPRTGARHRRTPPDSSRGSAEPARARRFRRAAIRSMRRGHDRGRCRSEGAPSSAGVREFEVRVIIRLDRRPVTPEVAGSSPVGGALRSMKTGHLVALRVLWQREERSHPHKVAHKVRVPKAAKDT